LPGPASSNTVYEPVALWGRIPHGIYFKDATAAAVDDDRDRVYVFNRGNHPMVVLNKAGEYVESWGQGDYIRPHGVTVDPEGNLFLADDLDHTIKKTDPQGNVIFTLGTPGQPSPWQEGGTFNRPTHVAIQPSTGDFFVSDGYGNSRIHKFDAGGNHIKSWGEPGTGPGQFSLPHNLTMIGDGKVALCDRENFRVQVFTTAGEYVDQWHFHRPIAIAAGRGQDTNLYVAEAGPPPVQKDVPGLGLYVIVIDRDGNEVTRFGAGTQGEGPDQFMAPHGMDTDAEGNVYIAEVSFTTVIPTGDTFDREPVSLRKWARVSG